VTDRQRMIWDAVGHMAWMVIPVTLIMIWWEGWTGAAPLVASSYASVLGVDIVKAWDDPPEQEALPAWRQAVRIVIVAVAGALLGIGLLDAPLDAIAIYVAIPTAIIAVQLGRVRRRPGLREI